MPPVDALRTYLELRDRASLRAARQPMEEAQLMLVPRMTPAEYRALYSLVGDQWHWRDRVAWTDEELDEYLRSPRVRIHVLRTGADVAGYFELREHDDERVEIMYFGLAPAFIGRGLGKWLLTRACEVAFDLGGRRVVLNTCTLDGPHALPNYLARGFTIVREERYVVEIG